MPWTYSQSTGELRHDGRIVGTGYSGAGRSAATGRNNPAMQAVGSQGPIPQGQWRIGVAMARHETRGPLVMRLTPVGHAAFGRDGFLIHGDNAQGDASEGCIILGPAIRRQIAASSDRVLVVIP